MSLLLRRIGRAEPGIDPNRLKGWAAGECLDICGSRSLRDKPLAGTAEIGRSILTTPGVPQERLAALRAAFQRMLADPDFLAAMAKRNVMIEPATGEAMDAVTSETMSLPKSTVEALRTLLKG